MLIRASLGMAVAMSLIGLSQNVYQLVGLRLLAGTARRIFVRLDGSGRDTDAAGANRLGAGDDVVGRSWPVTWPVR